MTIAYACVDRHGKIKVTTVCEDRESAEFFSPEPLGAEPNRWRVRRVRVTLATEPRR